MVIRKKTYISGKITGLEERMVRGHFNKAETELVVHNGIDPDYIFNPYSLSVKFPGFGYEDFMRIDMAALECCEQIYMLDNWEDSPGAKRELGYAKKLGLDIMWESEEVEKRKQGR